VTVAESPRQAPGAWPGYDNPREGNCEHEFAPDVDKLTMDGPPPLKLGADQKYPVPRPGVLKKQEY